MNISIAYTIGCPRCHQPAGHICRTPAGHPYVLHRIRYWAALNPELLTADGYVIHGDV